MRHQSIQLLLRDFIILAACSAVVMFSTTSAQELPSLEEAIDLHDAGEYEQALEMFLPLAEAGVIIAQNRLAHMHYWGEGTEKNPAEHHRWAVIAANAGDPYGQFDVATAYFSGRLFPADKVVGMEWLTKSAEGGDLYAQNAMGMLLIFGEIAPQDIGRGMAMLRNAATAGDPSAQTALGRLLLNGYETIETDVDEGRKWLGKAAAQRNVEAQFVLGVHLLATETTPAERVEAGTWLFLSADAGCVAAGPMLRALFAEMTAEMASQVSSRALAWDASTPEKDPHDHRGVAQICLQPPVKV